MLAHAWGLPGAGPAAARTLRDKIAMRAAADAGGLAQPRRGIAESVRDVKEFRDRYRGRCVLRPANRQASLGVRVFDWEDDAVEAWQHWTYADEPMLRARSRLGQVIATGADDREAAERAVTAASLITLEIDEDSTNSKEEPCSAPTA